MTSESPRRSELLPLTVCMIVRDEADKLAAALDSVRAVAREIVVVDTGSTDGTVAIAEAHGARVLRFAWVDDFAQARNVALAAASSDWILSLDADQRLPRGQVAALAHAVARRDCDAQVVTIEIQHDAARAPDAEDGGDVSTYAALRLFRRDPRIRYAGRVHEDVADALLAIGSAHWPDSGVTLFDGGYVDAADRRRKRERNLALLRASHAEAPDGLYVAYKLAITLPDDAVDERRAVLDHALGRLHGLDATALGSLPFMPRLVALAVDDRVSQGRLMDAVEIVRGLHAKAPRAPIFAHGVALARAGLADEARTYLEGFALHAGDARDAIAPRDDAAHRAGACCWLAWLARQQGAFERAARWLAEGAACAGPRHLVDIACDAVDLRLAMGDLPGAAAALDEAAAIVREQPSGTPRLMRVSAALARASGDAATALELAQAAIGAGDDAAVLLATIEIEAGPLSPERLRRHHDAIAGRRYDTLAVKLLIGESLGLAWPYAVPDATRAALQALRGG